MKSCHAAAESDKMHPEIAEHGNDSPGGSLTFTTLSAAQSGLASMASGAKDGLNTGIVQPNNAPTAQKLPDPWLFDSESLIREIDRIRETALQVPTNGDMNATHFGLQMVVNAAWTLRENIRYLLQLHGERQRSFRKSSGGRETEHQTVYVGGKTLCIAC